MEKRKTKRRCRGGEKEKESASGASGSEMLQVAAADEVLEAMELLLGLQPAPGSPQSSQECSGSRIYRANGERLVVVDQAC